MFLPRAAASHPQFTSCRQDDYDRTLLEYGFRVSNEAELRELLEDYIS